jgi:hypothetical protein
MVMKRHMVSRMLTLTCLALSWGLALAPLQAESTHCSAEATAGKWAYTYTGTILTAGGPLPAASVGHFVLDAAGNLTGSQARSVAGNSGIEDIAGTVSTNKDCTATATINVFVNGQLQRTAVLAVAYDNKMNHARAIFQSLTLPDGTNVPVVITLDETKQFPRN